MHGRTALGQADVSDDELAHMVATSLEAREAELLSSHATMSDYDLPSITTGGRWWVTGEARTPDGDIRRYRLFVKQVHAFSRSPIFATLPEEIRDRADAMVPWRAEPLVYRSNLGDHLPQGLAMPRALLVRDLDATSTVIWLEEVRALPSGWDLHRYTEAARLLGRMAASPALADYGDMGGEGWDVRDYLAGRLSFEVLPNLRSEELWHHPLVASAFDESLRAGLARAADRAPELVAELHALPKVISHGDACPGNLLVVEGRPGFTLIDFSHFSAMPLGFDLGQLLVGDVQIGKHPADDLAARDRACLAAYTEGLRSEGMPVETADVWRAHALQLMIFSGLTMPPFELLDAEPNPDLARLAHARAAIARHSLELLTATE